MKPVDDKKSLKFIFWWVIDDKELSEPTMIQLSGAYIQGVRDISQVVSSMRLPKLF